MTRETQSQLLGEFYAEKKNILKLKGEDYANEDVLSNFKTAGANCGISAEQQCLSLIATKVARLGNLLSGKTPNNESISDSILDLSNYTDLLYCLVNEDDKPKQKSLLKEMMKQDEKDGLYEPITEPYEPKVGDRFENLNHREYEIIQITNNKCVLKNKYGCRTYTMVELKDYIKGCHLKKIN
jgi:hypothetical protein